MTISLQSREIKPPAELVASLKQEGLASIITNFDQLFNYPNSRGDAKLIEACKRITPNWSGDALITNSATQALQYALQVVGRDKTIAVCVPAYFEIFDQAKALGQKILTWQNIDELKQLGKVDAIICTSNFTPPSGISFADSQKQEIADFAGKHDAYVIEDNAYDALWFNEKPPQAIPTDPNRAIRIASCSKNIAPGLRLGFVRANEAILEQIRAHKIRSGLGTGLPVQWLALPALSDSYQEAWRTALHQRSDAFRTEAQKQSAMTIPIPEGGPYLSLDIKQDPKALAERTQNKGLLIDTNGSQFADGQARSPLRLHIGAIEQEDIPEAVRILHQSIDELS